MPASPDGTDDSAGRRVRPITIRDVARGAGVSIGTASKALNGRGQLRPETRERVRAEAERLRFRPNDLIHSLLRGRTYTVGLLTTDGYGHGRFSLPLLTGIEDALGAAEILVFFCNTRDDPERERKDIESLLAKQVDGLIVMGSRTDPRPPIGVRDPGVPVVYAYTRVPDPEALCLLPDDAHGARLATEHLLRAGRRRLAHVTGPASWEAVALRRDAMDQVLAERGMRLPDQRVLYGSWLESWGYEAGMELLGEDPAVDGVFCGNDQIARGVIDALHGRGVHVPDDVAVVGFDNWEVVADAARPPLTTVDMNLHDLGREAAMRLLAMVDGERQSGVIRMPCSLVVRGSCGVSDPQRGRPGDPTGMDAVRP